jgi:hypothetical protein
MEDSLTDLNENNKEYFIIDEVENAIDSLDTIITFLERKDNLKWKWIAIALHHSLYSFCIACLTNSNYDNVLTHGYNEDNQRFVRIGNDLFGKKSRKIIRKNKKGYTIEWQNTEENPEKNKKSKNFKNKTENLIGFWTALARVQDQFFWMGRMTPTKAVKLSEEEWTSIEFLTDIIRNNLIHFRPKLFLVPIEKMKRTTLDVLRVIEFLALESNAISYLDYEKNKERITNIINNIRNLIRGV